MHRRWMAGGAGVALLLLAFWMIDLPHTVRSKVSILKSLPIAPATLNSQINQLCAGAHKGIAVSTCYLNFYSKEADEAVMKENRCRDFSNAVQTDKDWSGGKDADGYLYVGDDPKVIERFGGPPMFSPKDCKFYVISNGEIAAFSF